MLETVIGLIGAAAVVGAVGFAIWSWFVRRATSPAAIAANYQELRQKMSALELQLSTLTANAPPVCEVLRDVIVQRLTHAHAPELDGLLAKIKDDSLLPEEKERLFRLLRSRTHDVDNRVKGPERNAAIILEPLMRIIEEEKESPPLEVELRVVSVPILEDK